MERGSDDSDWQPAKDAAKKLAFAEDRAIFNGYAEADIRGIRECTSNPIQTLPEDVRDYPDAVAQALSQLRLVGVNGPYSVLLGAGEYTSLAETRDHGYPVLEHVKRIVDGNLIWAPAIEAAFVVTTRGATLSSDSDRTFRSATSATATRVCSSIFRKRSFSGCSPRKLPLRCRRNRNPPDRLIGLKYSVFSIDKCPFGKPA